jgi:PhnB protein
MSTVNPIPDGYHTVTPYLIVPDGAATIEFLKNAFGAIETFRMPGPDGAVVHAEVRIGDSMVMLGQASAEHKAMPCMIHLYVPDVDVVYDRALKAGAVSVRPLADQFYGDRAGGVQDAAGNIWYIGTHVEDVSPEEMERRASAQKG